MKKKRKWCKPSPTRVSYYSMKMRVKNPNRKYASRYILRGIDMDPRWEDYQAFLSDMGERPEGTSLDRIDNNRGYWPGNCRWATSKQQGNNRCNNVMVIFNGQLMTLTSAVNASGYAMHSYEWYSKKPENSTPQKAFDAMLLSRENRKRATDTHCAHGHAWDEHNLRFYGGQRSCLTCHNIGQKRRREARALARTATGPVDHGLMCKACRTEDEAIAALVREKEQPL